MDKTKHVCQLNICRNCMKFSFVVYFSLLDILLNVKKSQSCASASPCVSLLVIVHWVSMYHKHIKCVVHYGAQNSQSSWVHRGITIFFCNALHKMNIFQPKLLIMKYSLDNANLRKWSTAPRPYMVRHARTVN